GDGDAGRFFLDRRLEHTCHFQRGELTFIRKVLVLAPFKSHVAHRGSNLKMRTASSRMRAWLRLNAFRCSGISRDTSSTSRNPTAFAAADSNAALSIT